MEEAVSDNTKGLALAVASSVFIGASFILKKIGLLRAAKCGARAGTAPHPLIHLTAALPRLASTRLPLLHARLRIPSYPGQPLESSDLICSCLGLGRPFVLNLNPHSFHPLIRGSDHCRAGALPVRDLTPCLQ